MKPGICIIALSAALLLGCSKTEVRNSIDIVSVSETSFSSEGGLGTIETETGGIAVEATSYAPQWLIVSTVRENVLFKILPNESPEERKGTISINAGKLKGTSVEISQQAYRGLRLSSSNVDFSEEVRQAEVKVECSCEYSIEFSENPDGCFNCVKTAEGLVLSTVKGPGRHAVTGRLHIRPEDSGIPAAALTLRLREKSVYDYLIGTWDASVSDESESRHFSFSRKKDQYTFNVEIDHPKMAGLPFTADWVNGKVRIYTGQECGYNNDENKYLSLHYNGTKNGSGWYILQTAGQVAWDAEPVFDENAGTISLTFADSGINSEYSPALLTFWLCPDKYFNFYGSGASKVISYSTLTLTKELTE